MELRGGRVGGPVIAEIAVEGGAGPVYRISPPEPWRLLRTTQRAADPAMARRLPPSELVATGFFTSASGITVYRGSALGPDLAGNVFVGDVGGNLVHRKVLEPAGAVLRAHRADESAEFLASTDRWFRPANFANTPSGTLLVLDMYRETIEHPESIPPDIKQHLDLESGRDRGRIYELVPVAGFERRQPPRLSSESPAQWIEHLADRTAGGERRRSGCSLNSPGQASLPCSNASSATAPTPQARYLALRTLEAYGDLPPALLRASASDPEPGIRELVATLAPVRDSDILRDLARDDSERVRFQAALSAARIDDPLLALEVLTQISQRDSKDPWSRRAILIAAGGRGEILLERLIAGPEPDASIQLQLELARAVGAEHDLDRAARTLDSLGKGRDPLRGIARAIALLEGWRSAGGTIAEWHANPSASMGLNEWLEAARRALRTEPESSSREAWVRLLGLAGGTDAAREVLACLDKNESGGVQLAAPGSAE
jgi:hypothetical protein